MADEASDTTTRQTDARRKQQMKEYADRKNHASQVHLTVGDKVLVPKPRPAQTQQEGEENAEDDDIVVPLTQPRVIQQQQPMHQPERRYPQRIRRPRNRLADFVV